jgi:hypothetical protein
LMRGNRGGMGGASLPLPPNTGGHPMAMHWTGDGGLGLRRETKVAGLDSTNLGHEDGL